MTEQEKPVAIFLPQHRPGTANRPPKLVMAGVMATVTILGISLFFMMPRGVGDLAPVTVADAVGDAAPRDVSVVVEASAETAVAVDSVEVSRAPVEASLAKVEAPVSIVAAAPVRKSTRAADIPTKDDPRWARAETRQRSAALDAVRKLIVEKAAPVDESGSGLLAYAGSQRSMSAFPDPASTSQRPMQIVLPAELPQQAEDETRTASVNAPVNMRKGPGAKHGVILVIPRQAKVEIFDCDQWCKVGYDGRTGYIYKSFIRGRTS